MKKYIYSFLPSYNEPDLVFEFYQLGDKGFLLVGIIEDFFIFVKEVTDE